MMPLLRLNREALGIFLWNPEVLLDSRPMLLRALGHPSVEVAGPRVAALH